MAIILPENQYKGVNAHLHSYLLNGGDLWSWDMFAQVHACHITEALDPLPFNNYEVTPYYQDVLELYEVVIWQIEDNGSRIAVVRIAILSPRHKSHDIIHPLYMERRLELLRQKTVVVEIDYLYDLSPIHVGVPSYPQREKDARAYSVYIFNARPSFAEGTVHLYRFDVDETIPTLPIPLADNDTVNLDLNAAYKRTFESLRYFSNHVDYEQLPLNFEAYSASDQARIRDVMGRVNGNQDKT